MIATEATYTAIIALVAYLAAMVQKKSFSKLGETVTFKIRVLLYRSILQQNIGWFDLKQNATSVLTAAMATDTAVVNMAAGQSVGPMLEGFFAIVGGIVLAFVGSWQFALIAVGVISLWIASMTVQNILLKA